MDIRRSICSERMHSAGTGDLNDIKIGFQHRDTEARRSSTPVAGSHQAKLFQSSSGTTVILDFISNDSEQSKPQFNQLSIIRLIRRSIFSFSAFLRPSVPLWSILNSPDKFGLQKPIRTSGTLVCLLSFLLTGSLVSAGDKIRVEQVLIRLIEEVEVPAREGGALEAILVEAGDAVALDAPLVRLDTELQDLAVRQAQVELDIGRHEAADKLPIDLAAKSLMVQEQTALEHEVKRKISHQRAQSDVQVQSTRRKAEVSRKDLDRAIQARQEFAESISDSEIDLRKLNADQAQFDSQQAVLDHLIEGMLAEAEDLAQTSANLSIDRAKLEVDIAQDQHDVDILELGLKENQLATAQTELDRRLIKAPIQGIVVELYRNEGEWVRPGDSLVRIIRLDRLRAEGFFTAAQALKVKRGTSVTVMVNELGADPVVREGTITFVSPEIDPVNNEVRVWADFDNPGFSLLPGMHGTLEIQLPDQTPEKVPSN